GGGARAPPRRPRGPVPATPGPPGSAFLGGWGGRPEKRVGAPPPPLPGPPGRAPRRDVSLYRGPMPGATSAALAARLLGHHTRPSEAAVRAEAKIRLQEALNAMDPIDREVLALRHVEQLTNAEAALSLGIQERAAAKRY